MAVIMTGASADEAGILVKKHHYSRSMPSTVQHAFAWRKSGGLFGDTGEPFAAVTYGQPASRNFPTGVLELNRLVRHSAADICLSQFVSWSLRWLRANTKAPFIISYADPGENHHGGIYQALNFAYVGESRNGLIGFEAQDSSFIHGRACNHRFGTQSVEKMRQIQPTWTPIFGGGKHLYVFPLRQKLRSVLNRQQWKSKPYPKPNAIRPFDEPVPTGASVAEPHGIAPTLGKEKAPVAGEEQKDAVL